MRRCNTGIIEKIYVIFTSNKVKEYFQLSWQEEYFCEGSTHFSEDMSASTPLLSRVVGYSVAIANNAGKIIKDIMKKGELGIVEKEVSPNHYIMWNWEMNSYVFTKVLLLPIMKPPLFLL